MSKKSRIETPTDSQVVYYPWAIEMARKQQDIFWPAEELGVEEDEQDFRIGLNDAERHGVLLAQSIISKYELMIGGDELWGGKIAKLFPRPEIQRLCACISNVELGSHAPFYRIGNEVLGVATDEFYSRWRDDEVLSERIAFIDACAASKNPLEVTAALAFLEGAVLFSVLGFFKGFNARGFNLIPHFVAGIDGSIKDEDFHSRASSGLHQVCKSERKENKKHSDADEEALQTKIKEIAQKTYEHELLIIDKLFEVPGNRVISKEELIGFLQDRINIVLGYLNAPQMFKKERGEVSKWFYQQLSTVKVPDFFASTQLQYTRNWARHKLVFRKDVADDV